MYQSCSWCGADNGVLFDIHAGIAILILFTVYSVYLWLRSR